jgi:tRNA A37 methylthiotransferase MiaB
VRGFERLWLMQAILREWDTHELILQVAHRYAQTHSQMQADWQADRQKRIDVRTQAHVHVYISVQSGCKSNTFTDRERDM